MYRSTDTSAGAPTSRQAAAAACGKRQEPHKKCARMKNKHAGEVFILKAAKP
jgi:hypothetical protein